MSLQDDLLVQARHLATCDRRGRPKQANLRRAVSAAYYALFHLLVSDASGRLVRGADRLQLRYCLERAFSHANMKDVAQSFSNERVSPKLSPGLNNSSIQTELMRVAEAFVDLQQARHEADYNTARNLTKDETIDYIIQAQQAFDDWEKVRKSLQADVFLVGCLAQKNMRI